MRTELRTDLRTDLIKYAGAAGAAWLLSACAAAPDRIVLLPQANGAPSAVSVQAKAGGAQAILSQPYATAVVGRQVETGMSSAAEVRARYQPLLDALPARPQSHVLYFKSGGDQLVPESEARIDEILRNVKSFPAPEVVVIGHTDASGVDSINDEVSMKRAELIRSKLVKMGVDAQRIEAVGRGKRALLVPTADGVYEPRNRRVEIRVK